MQTKILTIQISVTDNWINDGFDITTKAWQDNIEEAITSLMPYSYPHEFQCKILDVSKELEQFEFINDVYHKYNGEIDSFVSEKFKEHNIQDEEGNYIDNEFDIDSFDEGITHFGYEWADEMVKQGKFLKANNIYFILK